MPGRQIVNPNELTPGLRVTVKDGRAPAFNVESNSLPESPDVFGVAFLRDDAGQLYHLLYFSPERPDRATTLAEREIRVTE